MPRRQHRQMPRHGPPPGLPRSLRRQATSPQTDAAPPAPPRATVTAASPTTATSATSESTPPTTPADRGGSRPTGGPENATTGHRRTGDPKAAIARPGGDLTRGRSPRARPVGDMVLTAAAERPDRQPPRPGHRCSGAMRTNCRGAVATCRGPERTIPCSGCRCQAGACDRQSGRHARGDRRLAPRWGPGDVCPGPVRPGTGHDLTPPRRRVLRISSRPESRHQPMPRGPQPQGIGRPCLRPRRLRRPRDASLTTRPRGCAGRQRPTRPAVLPTPAGPIRSRSRRPGDRPRPTARPNRSTRSRCECGSTAPSRRPGPQTCCRSRRP